MIPSGIVTTGWPAVKAKAAELGIHYDPWQDGAGRITLGKRADGKYAATIGGITWSIPRQVGKTFTVGTIIVVLCILFPGLKVVWTAHRTRTATNTFRALQGICRRKKVFPHILSIRVANGEQEIAFRNGSLIMFGAREQGFGRGIDEIDIEVFDEAQILTEKALEDMIAATNQARHPHGALLFFIGTPPRPIDPGEAFTLKRTKALSGKSDDMVYLEFSADPDADPDDHAQWAKANPSYPQRTPLESMLRLRENLSTDEGWRREALGIWDAPGSGGAFTPGAWARLGSDANPSEPACLAVAADVAQVWLSLGASSGGSVTDVGLVRRDRVDVARAEFVADVKRIQDERKIPVVVDAKGPASFLIPDLEEAGVAVFRANLEDFVQACAEMRIAVDTATVRHRNYPDLNAAVAAAGWRKAGERRVFARWKGDIDALEAVAWARWGVENAAQQRTPMASFV